MYKDDDLEFITEIPKIELHAHLNGSIRDETIRLAISILTASSNSDYCQLICALVGSMHSSSQQ